MIFFNAGGDWYNDGKIDSRIPMLSLYEVSVSISSY